MKSSDVQEAKTRVVDYYPTIAHARAAEVITSHFTGWDEGKAVLLINSCARSKASADSCLDMAILVSHEDKRDNLDQLTERWKEYRDSEPVIEELRAAGKYSHVDLCFIGDQFQPRSRSFTSGPDDFELRIGNFIAWSVPLWTRGDSFEQLRARWLPYYEDDLRLQRLEKVRYYFLNNLDHVPLYVERGLHFNAFSRVCDAMQEFLQALFIANRTYPIAYDKWIHEQLVEILELPDVYRQVIALMEFRNFESNEAIQKAEKLKSMFDTHIGKAD